MSRGTEGEDMGLADITWCEVDTRALASNVISLRRGLRKGVRLGIVVKANAYGHGLELSARAFVAAGADWLIANSVDEADRLRRAGLDCPVYICARVGPAQVEAAVRARARVMLCSWEDAEALGRASRRLGRSTPVHLKLETGMHRQGLNLEETVALARRVQAHEGLELEGLTTHYADSDNIDEHGFAHGQLELLHAAAASLKRSGMRIPMVHSANSAATLLWPETHGALVRVGLAAYGVWPSRDVQAAVTGCSRECCAAPIVELVPALSWRVRIAAVKQVPAGVYVGYGRTFRTTCETRLATLPIGYSDGYDRRLSNRGHVLVNGVRAPVRGRVCMNMTVVDVTHVPRAESEVVATLLGRDGDEEISAGLWAEWIGSIPYEALACIPPHVPRIPRSAGAAPLAANSRGAAS